MILFCFYTKSNVTSKPFPVRLSKMRLGRVTRGIELVKGLIRAGLAAACGVTYLYGCGKRLYWNRRT
jgi:hypothetical protein